MSRPRRSAASRSTRSTRPSRCASATERSANGSAEQDQLVEALGERRDLWLELEPLLGAYQADREEAHFDIVYENGLVAGRADALAASLRRRAGHHALASRMARLAVNAAGVRGPGALVALLEVAWALALGPRQPQTSRRTRRAR